MMTAKRAVPHDTHLDALTTALAEALKSPTPEMTERAAQVKSRLAKSLRSPKTQDRIAIASLLMGRGADDIERVTDLLWKVFRLSSELQHIEDGAGDVNRRAHAMREVLLKYGLVRPRLVRDEDGTSWLLLLIAGYTSMDALQRVANATGRSLVATRRNVARFFESLETRPPVAIPQLRQ